jgi:Domain of unknown function (DUF1830)
MYKQICMEGFNKKHLTQERSDMILCHYTNITRRPQIVRVENIENWFLERVIIPGGSLIFEAPAAAQLEIFSSDAITTTLSDRIWCEQLQFGGESESRQSFRNTASSRRHSNRNLTEIELSRRRCSA